MRLASVEALAALFLLVRSEKRLAAEFDALGLDVGPVSRGALQSAAALRHRSRDAKGRGRHPVKVQDFEAKRPLHRMWR